MWAFLCDRIETTPGLEIYLPSLQENSLVESSPLIVCSMTSSLELDRENDQLAGPTQTPSYTWFTVLNVSCFSPSAPVKPLRRGTRSGD